MKKIQKPNMLFSPIPVKNHLNIKPVNFGKVFYLTLTYGLVKFDS